MDMKRWHSMLCRWLLVHRPVYWQVSDALYCIQGIGDVVTIYFKGRVITILYLDRDYTWSSARIISRRLSCMQTPQWTEDYREFLRFPLTW